ncbi:MAG: hypothetical protein AUJ51_07685 [Elusimicrobia bacterium CG1_02_56_21]|nr:MAG: hypothetical protein AUJ51_07685 [Elusimicrobia bacterium CG1_02_56_21]
MTAPVPKAIALLPALLALQAAAGFARGAADLPDFNLNSKRASVIYSYNDDNIPAVPPPTDTGYYSGEKAGSSRLESLVKVIIEGEQGRAEISFPGSEYGEAGTGFRSSLFVKFAANGSSAVLSWASVLCSGSRYLGYKGASLKLPGKDGTFVIRDENLALGPQKTMLQNTHPWLVPVPETDSFQGLRRFRAQGLCPAETKTLDRLCSGDFPGKMKAYSVKALPGETGGYSFKYDAKKSSLTLRWTQTSPARQGED